MWKIVGLKRERTYIFPIDKAEQNYIKNYLNISQLLKLNIFLGIIALFVLF